MNQPSEIIFNLLKNHFRDLPDPRVAEMAKKIQSWGDERPFPISRRSPDPRLARGAR